MDKTSLEIKQGECGEITVSTDDFTVSDPDLDGVEISVEDKVITISVDEDAAATSFTLTVTSSEDTSQTATVAVSIVENTNPLVGYYQISSVKVDDEDETSNYLYAYVQFTKSYWYFYDSDGELSEVSSISVDESAATITVDAESTFAYTLSGEDGSRTITVTGDVSEDDETHSMYWALSEIESSAIPTATTMLLTVSSAAGNSFADYDGIYVTYGYTDDAGSHYKTKEAQLSSTETAFSVYLNQNYFTSDTTNVSVSVYEDEEALDLELSASTVTWNEDGASLTGDVKEYFTLTLSLDAELASTAKSMTLTWHDNGTGYTTYSATANYTAGESTATVKMAKDTANDWYFFSNLVLTVYDSNDEAIETELSKTYFCYDSTNDYYLTTISATKASEEATTITLTVNFSNFTVPESGSFALKYGAESASNTAEVTRVSESQYTAVISSEYVNSSKWFEIEATINDGTNDIDDVTYYSEAQAKANSWLNFATGNQIVTISENQSGSYDSSTGAYVGDGTMIQIATATEVSAESFDYIVIDVTDMDWSLVSGDWVMTCSTSSSSDNVTSLGWISNSEYKVTITDETFIAAAKTNGIYLLGSSGVEGTVSISYETTPTDTSSTTLDAVSITLNGWNYVNALDASSFANYDLTKVDISVTVATAVESGDFCVYAGSANDWLCNLTWADSGTTFTGSITDSTALGKLQSGGLGFEANSTSTATVTV
ncbi:MAG: hypothetical protein K5839_00385, partial [Treponemataceae bacterium]|nr:hypothetical protein [Treponemataceae bacterium]